MLAFVEQVVSGPFFQLMQSFQATPNKLPGSCKSVSHLRDQMQASNHLSSRLSQDWKPSQAMARDHESYTCQCPLPWYNR